MEQFKTHQVVMLPTDKFSNIVLDKKNNNMFFTTTRDIPVLKYQHLYFLSDEPINEGDWCINIDLRDFNHNVPFKVQKESNTNFNITTANIRNSFKKIIATTDSSLKLLQQDRLLGGTMVQSLPQSSQEWIKYYIEQYNLGNIITEVEIEVVITPSGIFYHQNNVPYSSILINPNNTINIKFPVENNIILPVRFHHENDQEYKLRCYTWLNEYFKSYKFPVEEKLYTRDEVIGKIDKFYHDSRVYVNSSQIDSVNTEGGFRAKWIKENL